MSTVITVQIDRPLGSVHPTCPNVVYPVNYGFVKGIFAPDGEEQDVYVLGGGQPLKTFTGRLIAVIRRKNDIEDKWVAAPEEYSPSPEEILRQVWFMEQYFDSTVEMLL